MSSAVPILAVPGAAIDVIGDGRQIGNTGHTLRSLGDMLAAITGGRPLWIGDVDPALAGVAADGHAWLDLFSFVFDPSISAAWPAVTEVAVSTTANTYTRSIISNAPVLNGTATSKTAKIVLATGSTANDRRIHTFDGVGTLDDIEVFTSLMNRNLAQQGIALRLNNIGGATTQNLYGVWNDATLGAANIGVGIWKGIDASFVQTVGASSYLETIEATIEVLSMTRATNVVTAVVAHNHQIRNADAITVAAIATSSFNGTFTVTSVSGDTITWNQTGTNESAGVLGIAGYLGVTGGRYAYPQRWRVRLSGTTLRAKVWRGIDPEPDWTNSQSVVVWTDATPVGPTGVGKVGFIDALHTSVNANSIWGRTVITRAERGLKIRESGVWRSVMPFPA